MNCIALPIPEVAPSDVAFNNAVFGRARDLEITVGATNAGLSFLREQAFKADKHIACSLGNEMFWIGFENVDQLPTNESLGIESISTLPEEIQLGVLELLFAQPLAALSNAAESTCEVIDFAESNDVPEDAQTFCLQLTCDTNHLCCVVKLPATLTSQLVEFISTRPLQSTIDYENFPIEIPIEAGFANLTPQALSQLQPNDVIVFEPFLDAPETSAVARFPHPIPSRFAHIESGAISFESQTQLNASPPPPGHVSLTIRTASVHVPINGLTNPQFRVPVTSPKPTSDPVTLWNAKQPIATGQLITIQKHPAIQLTNISPSRFTGSSTG